MRVTFASEPATPAHPNEDFVGATADAAVLLDGASAPAGVTSGCSHGVRWYSHTLGALLLAELTESTEPLPEILARGIERVTSLHQDTCDLSRGDSPSATVVMLRRTGDRVDWLVLCDSVLLLDTGAAEPTVVCDDRLNHLLKPSRDRVRALEPGTPEHAEAMREHVALVNECRNRDGGFWVASTDPRAAEEALTGSVPAEKVRAVALLSDGASRLVDRFHLATWREVVGMVDRYGPAELIRRVRRAERSDPDGKRWPRGKPSDDASAVYCTHLNGHRP
ncbi:protein phosphatase 2C domain-containing protein [Thermobispora bispora]|uniref:Integrase n=1 Tax=Thermobispora bispora (strain ATCC 19993 / DSM 43833 / CBS 139.67 / JCM 10125 / KCTC 9307 / NBRC 14880 / R51) TaxID=469371 RepID=D6Y3Q0_THEBD|nr:protein phosphatase 2C domain-containing protein [Thermobispora bispora]ADG87079.1 hypothetical protein Tbis_0349 [Thermobispora bispora DSM 43833]QSI47053.1 integrase [Thermobispora bispora]